MDAVTVARARSELPEMMDRVGGGERFVITSDGCNAVLMSEDEYRSLIETLHIRSDPDMAADLERTRRTQVSDMDKWVGRRSIGPQLSFQFRFLNLM